MGFKRRQTPNARPGRSPGGGYKARFAALAEEIANHPKTVLLHFSAQPPISDAALRKANKLHGCELSEEWLAIYRECNGMKLVWKHVDGENFDAKQDRPRKSMGWFDGWRNYGAGDGSFILLPLETALNFDTEGFLWFDFTPPDALGRRAVPFDAADMYYIFAFIKEPGDPNPLIRLGSDHGATFADSASISMSEYLELVLASRAVVTIRADYLNTYRSEKGRLGDIHVDLDDPGSWL